MGWLLRYRLRRTNLVLGWCIAFLLGVGLARVGYGIGPLLCWLCLPVAFLAYRRPTVLGLIVIVAYGGMVGCWRGAIFVRKLDAYQPLYMHKVVAYVRASNDAVYDKHKQFSFDANQVTINGKTLVGKVQVSGFGLNGIFEGDEIEADGTLRPGFGTYQASLGFAKLSLVAEHPSWVASVRRTFAAGMQTALPEPLASFAMGLLIGQRATLPDDVKQNLLMVGLTHTIAVSGYNLTIMLQASRRILGKRSKRIATALALLLIGLFLILAGSSASIVRAAIVSVLSIATSYYGRTMQSLNLLALAAVITVWASPLYIWNDISWYLSFLAFFGVMVVGPLITARLPKRIQENILVAVGVESLSAEAMTLPYVLHNFGQMSFVGLPANVLVVSLVPLAMLLSLIAGLAGTVIAPLAGWASWPARLLLNYMLDTSRLLAHLPHIFVQNLGLSLRVMLGIYVVVLGLTALLQFKPRLKAATITDIHQSSTGAYP